ncbi:MAG: dimethylsulfonioproprionate lyase family protein [Tabrizicola sp.]|uniref:dimethylsulfonioproprionate lyase family protein n=1 Tax=Tabrizicola sp. TaxID=2005166 RepID=UPI002ABD0769|nr:dimethylsulfonioproprionate lyase family protein [Tabrizicola sp.]MDZ4087064.1 dimethylsulfonioproprionate lyase family protein [Tabrizicola sp.]
MLLPDLLHALADLTGTEPRAAAAATAQALRAAAETDFPRQPPSALSPGILQSAALPGHPAARLIREAHKWLPWQDSPAAALQPTDLRAIKSVVTLLGPGAPIPSRTLRFGLFYQAPNTTYPLHAHAAAETYTILAGSVHWQAADRRFPLTSGEAIHHPPNLPHAMRAGAEGFLAAWRWSGDIGFDSYRMLPDPDV